MSRSLISTPQNTDPGSEGSSGYEYQRDVAILRCIEMIKYRDTKYVVCEFHEDVVQISRGMQLELVQVKKRESGNWTLDSLLKKSKKKKSILASLFNPLEIGKSVTKLSLCGFGRVATERKNKSYDLPELISLLNSPEEIQDDSWQNRLEEYEEYIADQLNQQGISKTTVKEALQKLCINFNLPHPASMEGECKKQLAKTLGQVWTVELNIDDIEEAYNHIYQRVKRISNKPKQQWVDKAVSREDMIALVQGLIRTKAPPSNRVEGLTTQDKLSSVGLGSKTIYAFQRRLDAIVLCYELNLSSNFWEDRKVDIDSRCKHVTSQEVRLMGLPLWQQLRHEFDELGTTWTEDFDDPRLDSQFAEGIFFDMTGICEAHWMRSGS